MSDNLHDVQMFEDYRPYIDDAIALVRKRIRTENKSTEYLAREVAKCIPKVIREKLMKDGKFDVKPQKVRYVRQPYRTPEYMTPFVVSFHDPSDAVMFKLAYGGAQHK